RGAGRSNLLSLPGRTGKQRRQTILLDALLARHGQGSSLRSARRLPGTKAVRKPDGAGAGEASGTRVSSAILLNSKTKERGSLRAPDSQSHFAKNLRDHQQYRVQPASLIETGAGPRRHAARTVDYRTIPKRNARVVAEEIVRAGRNVARIHL